MPQDFPQKIELQTKFRLDPPFDPHSREFQFTKTNLQAKQAPLKEFAHEEIRCIMVIVVVSRKYGIRGRRRRFEFNDPLGPISSSAHGRATRVRVCTWFEHTLLPLNHTTLSPSRIPRTYVLSRSLYLCASIKPTPTHHPFTTAYLRVVTRVSVSPRDTERRLSLPANCH